MSKLLIVESPGKISSLRKYLGSDWDVAASVGHIRDLPQKAMGIEPDTYRLLYEINEDKADVVKRLKSAVAKASSVYLATDPDREGEAIAYHLKEVLRLKDPYRVTFGEIQPETVRTAVTKPRRIDMNLVHAQEARRAVDRLSGYKGSPAVSQASGAKLSLGRVQTVAVRLLVDLENAIRAFVPINHFGVRLEFDGGWYADWRVKAHLPREQHFFLDESFAKRVALIRQVTVHSCDEKKARRAPPAPFVTATLQQAGSIKLDLTVEETMALAQKLYEGEGQGGYISYHRTDKPCLSEESFSALREFAKTAGIPLVAKMRTWSSKAGAQEAHEAIRPTNWALESLPPTSTLSDKAKKLYELIRARAIASQMPDAIYDERVVVLRAVDAVDQKEIWFDATGRVLSMPGWLSLSGSDSSEEDEKPQAANPVPPLEVSQQLVAVNGQCKAKRTEPPKRFNEATLVRELERMGIGRPSTYASIISTIKRREYVEIEKKIWRPTKLAEALISMVSGTLSIAAFGFTSEMEERLDQIAAGKGSYVEFVRTFDSLLDVELKKIKPTSIPGAPPSHYPCPTCKRPMYKKTGKSGAFWGCSGYPNDCKTTLPDAGGVPLTPESAKFCCPKCGQPLVRRQKKDEYDFWGCTGYPACKSSFPNERNRPVFDAQSSKRPVKS